MSEVKRTKKSASPAVASAPAKSVPQKAVNKKAVTRKASAGQVSERPFNARSGTLKVTLRPGEAPQPKRAIMSAHELASLGGGHVAYIKVMTQAEAMAMFPAVEDLPQGINLYALHAADGTPLALTDTLSAALGQAMGDELVVAAVH